MRNDHGKKWPWLAAVVAVLSAGSACVYRQDDFVLKLEAGDVTGVITGVPPGESGGVRPLKGARVQLLGSSMARASSADGRFTLRNLPVGTHQLLITWDPDGDRVPDLARVLKVPISIPAGRNGRPAVDLGSVTLLRPGAVGGTVTGMGPLDDVLVVVEGIADSVTPDPVTGAFVVPNLGVGEWTVRAVSPPSMASPARVAAGTTGIIREEGSTVDVGAMALELAPGDGVLQAELAFQPQAGSPGGVSQGLSSSSPRAVLTPLNPAWPTIEVPSMTWGGTLSGTQLVMTGIPAGAYSLTLTAGPEFNPIRIPNLVIPRDGDVLRLVLERIFSGNDMDADGLNGRAWMCAELSGACAAACDVAGATSCEDGTDCDDDGDGVQDTWEACGRPLASGAGRTEPCRCGETGPLTGEPTCETDSTRYDLDHDGICDLNQRACLGLACVPVPPPTDAGVPDAATMEDAGMADAGVDAGMDAGPGDAGVDAGMVVLPCTTPTPTSFTMSGQVLMTGTVPLAWGAAAELAVVGAVNGTVTWEVDDLDVARALPSGAAAATVVAQPQGPESPADGVVTRLTARWMTGGVPAVACVDVASLAPAMAGVRVVQGVTGTAHTLLRLSDGTAWAMGRTAEGQVGTAREGTPGRRGREVHPAMVHGVDGVGALRNVVDVSACGLHSIALLDGGVVVGFGDNAHGQLGTGADVDGGTHVPRVLRREGNRVIDGIVDVSCGTAFSAVLTRDGGVLTFGANTLRQLGRPTPMNADDPVAAPVVRADGGSLPPAARVVAGFDNAGVLVSDGTAWWWGKDVSQPLFVQDGEGSAPNPPAPVADLQPVPLMGATLLDLVFTGEAYVGLGRTATGETGAAVMGTLRGALPLYSSREGHWSETLAQVEPLPQGARPAKIVGGKDALWTVATQDGVDGGTWFAAGEPGFGLVDGTGTWTVVGGVTDSQAFMGGMGQHVLWENPDGGGPLALLGRGRNHRGQLGSEAQEVTQGFAVPVAWRACGNGTLEPGEQCDPLVAGGPPCTSTCRRVASPDNGFLEDGEPCDSSLPGLRNQVSALAQCTAAGAPLCSTHSGMDGGFLQPHHTPAEACDDGDDSAADDGCHACRLDDACGRLVVTSSEPDRPITRDALGIPLSCNTWWFQVDLDPADAVRGEAWVAPASGSQGFGSRVTTMGPGGALCGADEDTSLLAFLFSSPGSGFVGDPPEECGEAFEASVGWDVACSNDVGTSRCSQLEFSGGETSGFPLVRVRLQSAVPSTIRVVVQEEVYE